MNDLFSTATLLAVQVAVGSAVAASGYAPPLLHVSTADGVVLAAERNERTLYVAEEGRPLCTADCTLDWPPFLVSPDDFPSDGLEILHDSDGARQWSLLNLPLHFFAGDMSRGEANGDGIRGWRALRPDDLNGRPHRESARSVAGDGEPL